MRQREIANITQTTGITSHTMLIAIPAPVTKETMNSTKEIRAANRNSAALAIKTILDIKFAAKVPSRNRITTTKAAHTTPARINARARATLLPKEINPKMISPTAIIAQAIFAIRKAALTSSRLL